MFHRSSYELQAFKMLEQMSEVKSYEYEPLLIPYEFENQLYTYIPDILISYNSGVQEIIEIKPKALVEHKKNLAKFSGLQKYCQENNILSSIWTEDNLFFTIYK